MFVYAECSPVVMGSVTVLIVQRDKWKWNKQNNYPLFP